VGKGGEGGNLGNLRGQFGTRERWEERGNLHFGSFDFKILWERGLWQRGLG